MIRPYRNPRGLAALALQMAALGLVIVVAHTAVLGAHTPVAEGSPRHRMAAARLRQATTTDEPCTGPDPYDPAAGCHPEQSLLSRAPTNSGDDWYDPAALGTPAQAPQDVATERASDARCGLSLDEIVRRILRRIPGGYSGDDAYDPAAGGTPELSVLASCASTGHP
jgi:hypothetical protein